MKNLAQDWLTQGTIDFEYKKYVLLAYLQEVRANFDRVKLYPYLSDVVFHYQNLISIRNNQELFYEKFAQKLTRADFEQLTLHYEKIVKNDALMEELGSIIAFAIPQIKTMLDEGKDLYEYIESNLEINTIGLTPLHDGEGYLFIDEAGIREIKIYTYQLALFENATEKYRALHLQYLDSVSKSIFHTVDQIKVDVIKKNRHIPNPATFLIHSKIYCPLQETLLPIAKRLLMKHLQAA